VMEWLKVKLESIGFGVFIPAFFVMTGADLQLDTLFSSNRALVIMVLTIVAFLLIRGLPVLGLYRSLDGGMRFRLALIASTQLPLVATLMNRLVESGDVPEDIATAVIAGSVLTVALFPIIAFIGVEDEEEPLIWGAIRRRVKPAVEALPAIEAREENDE
jgi:Kef-type K+ transport system membrane component KefB